MSPILSILLFAAAAAAEVTTSIWMPSPYQDGTHIGFYASVVGVDSGRTTLAMHFDNNTDLRTAGYEIDHKPNTMTFIGNSRFESVQTTTEAFDGPALTMGYGCQMTTGRDASVGAVCRFSSNGPAVHSSVCDRYTDYTEVYTFAEEVTYTAPYTVVTKKTVIDDRTLVPSYCKSGSTLPDSVIAHTYAIEQEDIATYQVVITAGEEKLSATAGATPSSSGAVATGTGAFTLQRGQNAVPTGTTAPLPQETGAAGIVLPLHPALAGLGAAAMAFLL